METVHFLNEKNGFGFYIIDEKNSRLTVYNQYGDWVCNCEIRNFTHKGIHFNAPQFFPNTGPIYIKYSQLKKVECELGKARSIVKKSYDAYIEKIIAKLKS